ncbi:YqgQ family protein [Aquisalibacillus elongatus]|uniref:Uncharacterized protein YqgQ n=1 Tax=Aquisalibacillus elongatus TaxID=485577 RepID=A0A3N5C0N3_9BACI|nr:YqgQ family protein [Aquisalibacillus elongatus]RPF55628.1 uncharacterized protein YqgQ [Aquisalibacillus elongatus]
MDSMIDVRNLLKRFGIFVYIGEQKADLLLMEDELQSLFENQLISNQEYAKALLIIKKEKKDLEKF